MDTKILASLLLFLTLTACNRTMVSMTSTPTEAHVIINKEIYRFTPFTVNYSNINEENVDFIMQKDGYKTFTGFITKEGEVFREGEGIMLPTNGVYHFDLEKNDNNQ